MKRKRLRAVCEMVATISAWLVTCIDVEMSHVCRYVIMLFSCICWLVWIAPFHLSRLGPVAAEAASSARASEPLLATNMKAALLIDLRLDDVTLTLALRCITTPIEG